MSVNEKHVENQTHSYDTAQDPSEQKDVFGNEQGHDIQFRSLTWPFVAAIMITEIVNAGTFLLPQALAVVGMVPGLIVMIFCGAFALFTAILLIDFKLNHPEVHNMGDAGYILMEPFNLGWLGREVLSAGTILFAIISGGSQQLIGGDALATLSDGKLCQVLYTGIFAIPVFVLSLPRTFDFGLTWLSAVACVSIVVACLVGMIGAGLEPTMDRLVQATAPQSFYVAFYAITNPVIAFAGHFMFFPLISEMKTPEDAKKSAWALQIVSTLFYVLYSIVTYVYIGSNVQSPSFLSLPTVWAKAAWGLLFPNMLVSGALNSHVSAKIIFVRIFRNTPHLHSHTLLAWVSWIALCAFTTAAGFVLVVGVPIFSPLAGITASLFAAWYTYGLAGAFWLHDTSHLGSCTAYKENPEDRPERGWRAFRKQLWMFCVAIFTLAAGAFICVCGLYVNIRAIVLAYATGAVGRPFTCATT